MSLIELLVATAVLAVLATMGWRALDAIARARVALTEELESARGLQLAFAQMQRDCAYVVSPSSLPDHAHLSTGPGRFVLVRQVFAENRPMQFQVVAYRLHDGALTRWESDPTRDLKLLKSMWEATLERPEAVRGVMLQNGVSTMAARVWASDGNGWREDADGATGKVMIRGADGNWRPAQAADAAANTAGPSGLEVTLQLRREAGPLRKIFLLGPA